MDSFLKFLIDFSVFCIVKQNYNFPNLVFLFLKEICFISFVLAVLFRYIFHILGLGTPWQTKSTVIKFS